MSKIKYWVIVLFLFFFFKNYSVTYTSTGCPATWTGFNGTCPFFNGATRLSFQPATGDVLIIPAGCTVTVSGAIAVNNCITFIVNGQLRFNGPSDKIDFHSCTQIQVNSGGSLSGASNSNQIKIGTGPSEWSGPGTNSGPFTLTNGSVLPVELIEFTGTCVANGAQLNWSTASETTNAYFLVEKSSNAVEWLTVAKVAGNGTSGSVNKYFHLDYDVNTNEHIYYRLTQVDENQSSEVFTTIEVLCGNDIPNQMLLFSNPASTELNIFFNVNNSSPNSSIRLMNNMGQIVMDAKIDLIKGLNSFVFPIDINPGTYHIMFSSENIVLPSQKLLIVK